MSVLLLLLRRHWMLVGLVLLIVAQAGQAYMLRQAIRHERVDRELLEAAVEAARTGKPVEVNVSVPGAPEIRLPPINVRIEPPTVPGTLPRVLAESTTPIPCKTDEECRRIFGAAEQAIRVQAELRKGTAVPVCLVDLVDGECPAGQSANRPLAASFALNVELVRLTSGAYAGLAYPGSPLNITRVETATRPIGEIRVEAPRLAYNLSLAAFRAIVPLGNLSDARAFSGGVYQNWASGGVYEIGGGYSWPGTAIYLGWNIPLR